MNYPLISVIVPVYKVEEYLNRCVDSILKQTYPNIEIVLVDDGSPDNCGTICDKYAQKHNQIVVIHQKNGGLSAARNSGLEMCHGEYIGFVDGDDYIFPEMYQQLFNDITKYNTKLAFCHTNVFRKGQTLSPDYGNASRCERKEYVMKRALNESIWWSACTKLYHRSLFDGIRFPEGKTNEDLGVMIYIFDKCDNIVVNPNKLYNYWIRSGSITTSSFNIHKFDIVDNAQQVAGYLHHHHPEMEPAAKAIVLSSSINLLEQIQKRKTKEFENQKLNLINIIRQNWPSLLFNHQLSKSQRILLTAAFIHPSFLEFTFRLRKKLLK